MNTTEIAYLYEQTRQPGGLFLSSLMVLHPEHPVPLSFQSLEQVVEYARAQGCQLEPMPDEEGWDNCCQLSDEAWATVRRLMAV